jgi:hypothetical protein
MVCFSRESKAEALMPFVALLPSLIVNRSSCREVIENGFGFVLAQHIAVFFDKHLHGIDGVVQSREAVEHYCIGLEKSVSLTIHISPVNMRFT